MKSTVKYNIFYLIGIFLFFIASSYAALLPNSYLDDVIVIFLAAVQIVDLVRKKGNIRKEHALTYILLLGVVIRFLQSYLINGNTEGIAESFFSYFKIIIVLSLAFYIKLDKEGKMNILKMFVFLSFPNLARGVFEYYTTYIRGIYLPGKYEYGLYRLQGFTGHPIFYSILLVICLCYLLYCAKGMVRFVLIALCTFLAIYTRTTLTLVFVLLLLAYYAIHKTILDNIVRKYSKGIMVCALVGICAAIFLFMGGETNTIRFVAIMKTFSNLNILNFFIGDGFGTYAQAGLSESYLFHVMYETGILGVGCLLNILFVLLKKQLKEKNYIAVFAVCFYLVSSLINEGYMIPFIIYIPILCCASSRCLKENLSFDEEIK